jgi:hypothetical protein
MKGKLMRHVWLAAAAAATAFVLLVTPAESACVTTATLGVAQVKLVGAGCMTASGTRQTTPPGAVALVNGFELHPAAGVSLTLDSATGTLSSGGGDVTIDVGVASMGQTQVELVARPIDWRVLANPGEKLIPLGDFKGAGAAKLLSLPLLSGIKLGLRADGKSDADFTVEVPLLIPKVNGIRATTTVESDNTEGAHFKGLDAEIKLFHIPGVGEENLLAAPFTNLTGHLKFRLPDEWAVDLAFTVPGVGAIDGKFSMTDGKPTEIAITGTYNNPGIALGNSGAFLQTIGARFAHYPTYTRPLIGFFPTGLACGFSGLPKCQDVHAINAARAAECMSINDQYEVWLARHVALPSYCHQNGAVTVNPPLEVDGHVKIAAGPVLNRTSMLAATGTLRYVDSYFIGTRKVPWAFDVEGSLELGELPLNLKPPDAEATPSGVSKFNPINHSGVKAWLTVYGDGKVQAGGGFDYKLPRTEENWLLSIKGNAAVSLLPKGSMIGRPSPGATAMQYAQVVQREVDHWTVAGTVTGEICAQIPTVFRGCATGAAGISNNGVAGCAAFELPGTDILQAIATNGAKAINAVARFGREAGEKLNGVFVELKEKAKQAADRTGKFFEDIGTGTVKIVNQIGDGFKTAGKTIAGWFGFSGDDPISQTAANEVINENVRVVPVNFAIGAAYRWRDGSTIPITSCSHDQLLQALTAGDVARAAAGGLPSVQVTTHIKTAAPRMFEIKGTTAAPDVLVMGPDDRAIVTDGPGFAEPGWIVYKDPALRTTYVEAADAIPGKWDFVAAPGSSRIASVETAAGVSIPTIVGGLTNATHGHFVISYRISGEPRGDLVRLEESDGSSAPVTFATLHAGHGTVPYTPSPYLPSARRVILALVTRGSTDVSAEPITALNLAALAKR